MLYRLTFFDAQEEAVRKSQIEAPNDDDAVRAAAGQCIESGMAIEITTRNRHLVRITPLTARLFLD